MMFICSRGKDDYLTGAVPQPMKEDPKFKGWKVENNMVIFWLINLINNETRGNFILYEMTQEIQEVKYIYSDIEDTTEAFEIEGILHDLRQGDLFATQYFNLLARYWQQLDMFETIKWDCPMDAIKYKKIVEKKQT